MRTVPPGRCGHGYADLMDENGRGTLPSAWLHALFLATLTVTSLIHAA
jgi:hypothetical protein